jgi:hypothetical protein
MFYQRSYTCRDFDHQAVGHLQTIKARKTKINNNFVCFDGDINQCVCVCERERVYVCVCMNVCVKIQAHDIRYEACLKCIRPLAGKNILLR